MDAEQIEKLKAKLPTHAIRTRTQGGQSVRYIEGYFAIRQANEVFGFDGWSYETRAITEVARFTRPGKTGENTVIIYEAAVTVTALGVDRSDVGIGVCDSGPNGLAQGIEKARKEAVTDGIKRALRSFGSRFGLALYDKSGDEVGGSFEAQDLCATLADCTDLAAWNEDHRAELEALDESDKAAVRAAYAARQRALRPATPAAAAPAPARPIAETAEAEFKAATSAASLEAAVSRHAKALAALAEQDRLYLRNVIRTRREELARFELAAQLMADAGRATNASSAQAVYERLAAAAKAGKLTQEQAESITETLNERLSLAAA